MTTLRCISFFLCTLFAATSLAAESTAALERSIGRVILESDKYPHGAHFVSAASDRDYKSIRKLPPRR